MTIFLVNKRFNGFYHCFFYSIFFQTLFQRTSPLCGDTDFHTLVATPTM